MPVRVCFVCSGNICRSPTAEVVLRALAQQRGVDLDVDSAGTGGWHAGDDMDERSRAALVRAGYDPATHSAKQFEAEDFATRDLVVALDRGHLTALRRLAPSEADRDKILLLRTFDPSAGNDLDVADPYYGGPNGFRAVLEQVERACEGLLQQVDRPCL